METPVPVKSNKNLYIIIGVVLLVCCCLAVAGAAVYSYLSVASTAETTFDQVQEQLEAVTTQGVPGSEPGAPLFYGGLADSLLQADTLKTLEDYESSQGCSEVSLLAASLSEYSGKAGDPWSELWVIQACGEPHSYTVTFTPSPTGGTDIHITGAK